MQKNSVFGVILASGQSKRMGQNKLLLHLNGKTIFEHTLIACKNSNLEDIVVVTSFEEIKEICRQNSVNFIQNDNAKLGQSESIKLGTSYFYEKQNIMFITADTPYLSEKTINDMIFSVKNEILVPFFEETPQNPVIFPKKTFDDLLKLTGDVGGKKVIAMYNFSRFDIEYKNQDIDTLQDYERVKRDYND